MKLKLLENIKMKYVIKNILKEDYVNKKKGQEYLNFIVNEMLGGVTIENDYPPNPSFDTLNDFLDLYGDKQYDVIVSDPKHFNKLGWEESDQYDDYYYFRVDNPDHEYDTNEFFIELGYDWLKHLEEVGEVRVIDDNRSIEEWELVHQDLLMNLNINGYSINEVRLSRVFSEHKYNNPISDINRSYKFIESKITNIFKINKEEFEIVFTKFKSELVTLVKDKWGVDLMNYGDNINESIVDDFIEFGKNELSLGDGFNVRLTNDSDELETLASYDMSKNEISVMSKNRAIPDIIRSIAHEMVHHKQNELGDLKGNPEEGEDGSPWEDQANSKAGEIVRRFGKEFPEIYDL
ncbi:MAG: hypothetical protein ACXACY_25200 [Candidatus Hodarchaeales archaeon]|jgi:hypothetical protein